MSGDPTWQYAAILAILAVFILVMVIIVVSVSKKGAMGNQGETGAPGPTGQAGTAESDNKALILSFTGAAADVSTGLLLTRIGNSVTLFLEETPELFVATEAGTNPMSVPVGTIPKTYRNNTSDLTFIVPTLLNGATTTGIMTVTVDGALILAPQLANQGWPNASTNSGWQNISVSYLIG